MDYYSPLARATRIVIYILAVVIPVAIALAVVGTTPYLLAKVPEQHRSTVAAIGEGAVRLSGGNGGIFGSPRTPATAAQYPLPAGTMPYKGEWSPRRAQDFSAPAGLRTGLDYSVMTTDGGHITHWPCGHEIQVSTFGAPSGNVGDVVWAVDTLAWTSGLPLRYAGPGAEHAREAEGTISVTFGHHPDFDLDPTIAGVGGPTALWADGRISRGAVTLRPEKMNPYGGDPGTRTVILHELMHAVGVNHAADHRAEVMAPQTAPIPQTILGYGDRFALHMVGCH
ncbi:UNVERIFIED_ORG: hypothetical protein EDC92_10578 [Dietzia maris]|uniref:hypothetical protein n=2 Tax=Dietziaceae TaxID=85029 RepID=UPI0010F28CC4|nr:MULTISPECIES: hypothetical protein [Dietzia]MCZ4540492.1 hypothetical protein [Dietzia maris]MDV3354207.1 hypothetical protein [Dietzia sp. IN118]